MKLEKLLSDINVRELLAFSDVDISGISYNSKTTKIGDIFICLVGEHSDGHKYAESAIKNGARAIVTEHELEINIPQVIVNSTRFEIANFANKFYNSPSKEANLIGVTGTNGKTTVTHLVQKIFEKNYKKCSLIGTLGYKLSSEDEYKDAKHTTPQAPELQETLDLIIRKENIKNIIMEVSSHALEQNRVGGCEFNTAILTNLTQDHLDYHITMDNYFESKAILFNNLKPGSFAIINADDKYADRFIKAVPEGVKVITYGIKNKADISATDIKFSLSGAEFICIIDGQGSYKVKLLMNGMFSVYNVLAAFCAGIVNNIPIQTCIEALSDTKGVAGRFEAVVDKPLVIVDYAHTPDGLKNVLTAAKEITPSGSSLICVFGCGGDRDATKRPQMGAIAEEIADKIVITSDNPRSEDPQQIITDILTGLKSINTQNVFVEADRGKAINLLTSISKPEDVIVIAGKGHEDYQIIKDKTIHFDDKEEARKVFY